MASSETFMLCIILITLVLPYFMHALDPSIVISDVRIEKMKNIDHMQYKYQDKSPHLDDSVSDENTQLSGNNKFQPDIDKRISVHVDLDYILSITNRHFIGVAFDTGLIYRNWGKLDLRSKSVMVLAQALSPCYLRVGGTMADFLIFGNASTGSSNPLAMSYPECNTTDCGNMDEPEKDFKNFTMSAKTWDELNEFVHTAGWKMIFGLNVLLRNGGHWDSTNAVTLLKYTARKGYNITGFELGNEPNAFNHTVGYKIQPDVLAKDFLHLREILDSFPVFASASLFGPDVTQVSKIRALDYFNQFLKSGGSSIVEAATFHHYYVNSRTATLDQFINSTILDGLAPEIIRATETLNETAPNKRVWLGETSSSWGGGAPKLSDRYVAGFMWLDKLGLSASLGIDVVIRQSFYGGHYALLNGKTCQPNPDYWLTVLFKTLVGRVVLNVTIPDLSTELRLYAHCTNTQRTNYTKGAVTVYGMNLHDHQISFDFSSFYEAKLHVYLMEPEDGDLHSSHVKLNGHKLNLTEDNRMPNLMVPRITTGTVHFPARTFGFIVIPDAAAKACMLGDVVK